MKERFIKHGSEYRLLEKRGLICIYELWRGKAVRNYEVVVLQQRAACFLGRNFIPAAIVFPSASQWGVFGWTYLGTEREAALAKFADLDKQYNKPRRIVRRIERK